MRLNFLLKGTLITVAIFCISLAAKCQNENTEQRILHFLKGRKATVGLAVLQNDSLIMQHNNHIQFPLLSVFKFHVALAVLDRMDREGTSLEDTITVRASQMLPNTYSPLREKYPGQDFRISLGGLLKYMVSMSDNNACDILIDYAGGITAIHNYITKLGIKDFNLSATEEFMHLDDKNAYLNRSTPSEVTRLMSKVENQTLFAPAYKDFLRQIMLDTSTGADKLRGSLPPETRVGHKTGSSGRTPQGMKIADNDAGFVILPDGKQYYIAVFVMDSMETDKTNASIIAHLSKMVYEKMLQAHSIQTTN